MRARCRALDWAATPLGPVAAWPAGLRTAAALVLAAAFPTVLLRGPELVQLYNDGYRDLMGVKHPAGLGQPTRECWPEVWHLNAPIYERVWGGETVVLEDALFQITRSGVLEDAWFTLSYSPVQDGAGAVAGVLVTVFETTPQRRARDAREQERERLLAESEAARRQVTATLESISDAFYAVDAAFRFTYVNRKAEVLWGRTRASLLGRHYWTEFPQAVGSEAYRQHHVAMAERRAVHFEAVSPIVGRWLDVSLYPDEASGGLACYFRDATERKAAEAALREREARFRLMADAVPQIVWITDAEGRTEFFNRQWTRYTGAPYEPTTAAAVAASFVHPDDAPATVAAFDEARRTGGVFAVEHRIRSAAGDYRWFLVRAEPNRDPETGAVVRWFGASVDIHDRKQAEAALAASEARHAFLLALQDRLLPVTDAEQIQFEAAAMLGRRLGASRVGYAEDQADSGTIVVTRNYTDGVLGIEGRYRYDDYGPELLQAFRAGRTVVRPDVANDPSLTDAERAAHAPLQLGATVNVPLVRGGRLVAVLFAHHRGPHAWTAAELTLLGDVAARTWEAVERARAEAALAESEARYRLALDVAELGTWTWDLATGAGDLDARGAAIVGLPAGELADVAAAQFGSIHPDDLAPTRAAAAAGIARGEPFDLHYRVVHPDGSVHHVASRASVGTDAEGRPVRLVGTNRDVTAERAAAAERARLLAELGAERERLRSVVLHTPAPLALTEGPEHRFTLVNEAYKRVSGGGRDVTGLTPREAFPELAGSGIHELFDHVFATGEPWVGPETLVRYDRDGTGVQDTWFDLRFEPVRAAGADGAPGRVIGILNLAVEVTAQVRARHAIEELLAESERARAEAEATRAAEREARAAAERAQAAAEAANRAKGEFLAVMSHELRTPLNAIGGYAELIELGIRGPVTDQQRADLARIQQSQRHLLGLINQVLNYTRVDAGAVRYDLADVRVAEALAAAEALVLPQARARGLTLVLGDCPPELAARADREKLQQILLNLLTNAVKFTGAGGAVRVSCAGAGERVAIAVADTGVGIAPEKVASVFEPFVQVDQRLTRPHEGVGLGLAISRDLARGMGGDLTVESTPDVGSTFTITLPAA